MIYTICMLGASKVQWERKSVKCVLNVSEHDSSVCIKLLFNTEYDWQDTNNTKILENDSEFVRLIYKRLFNIYGLFGNNLGDTSGVWRWWQFVPT